MEVPPHQIFNSNTELYMSMPLSGHLIRVLDLDALPRNSSDSEPLTGQLRIENLRHRPKYTALSYVWGMHSPGYSIRCGNRSLSITPNLSDALVSLRHQFGAMTIWVDAICINQGDEDEKDHQIPLMDVIYSCATTVYIWLGDGTSTSSDAAINWLSKASKFRLGLVGIDAEVQRAHAIQPLQRLYSLIGHVVQDLLPTIAFAFLSLIPAVTNAYGRQCNVADLEDLLNHGWTTRAWTYQEIILAKRPIIVSGNQNINWDKFIRGIYCTNKVILEVPVSCSRWITLADHWLRLNHPWDDMFLRCDDDGATNYASFYLYGVRMSRLMQIFLFLVTLLLLWPPAIYLILVIISLSISPIFSRIVICWLLIAPPVGLMFIPFATLDINFSIFPREEKPTAVSANSLAWRSILRSLRLRRASNPRDQARALYGILKRQGVDLTNPSASRLVGEVYADLFRDLLSWRKESLRLIIDSGISEMESKPSWVPDWSTAVDRCWLDESYIFDLDVSPSATPRSRPEFSPNREVYELTVSGVHPQDARISYVCQTLGSTNAHQHNILAICLLIRRLKITAQIPRSDDNTLGDIIFRILNLKGGQKEESRSGRDRFHRWYQAIQDIEEKLDRDYGVELLGREPELSFSESATLEIHRHFCNAIAGKRRLCTIRTTSGELAGTGPMSMQRDDLVVLISGVPVPMVLREIKSTLPSGRDGKAYAVIGPAFVPGMMEGEMWPKQRGGNRTENRSEVERQKFLLL